MKVLVLASEPISADALRAALGEQEANEAEVMLVSPALSDSPLRFWATDVDDAIAHAQEVVDESVERLSEEGVDAAGDTGDSDPVQAVQAALATFPAERIVVFAHPDGDRAYREDELVAETEQRFGLPVTRWAVTR